MTTNLSRSGSTSPLGKLSYEVKTGVAYPMLRCNLLGEYVAPTFVCEEFKGGKS